MRTALLFFFVAAGAALMLGLSNAQAAFSNVIISEVAWMGTTTDGGKTSQAAQADEWIELFNPTTAPVALEGWILRSATDGGPTIALSGNIAAGDFYLLERTDDTTTPAPAQWTGSFGNGLSNGGETLELVSPGGLKDFAVWTNSGPGDATTKNTLERRADGDWGVSLAPNGTPGATNSIWQGSSPAPTPPPPSPTPPPPPPPTPSKTEPSTPPPPDEPITNAAVNILLWEFLPNPEGSDADGEFIELRNDGDANADVSGWKLKDASGSSRTLQGAIAAKSFLLLQKGAIPSLNNDGDTIELLDAQSVRRDALTYQKAPEGYAVARFANGWQWTAQATPGQENILLGSSSSSSSLPSPSPSGSAIAQAPLFQKEDPQKNMAENDENDSPETMVGAQRTGSELSQVLRNNIDTEQNSPVVLYGLFTAALAGLLVFGTRILMKRKRVSDFIEEDR